MGEKKNLTENRHAFLRSKEKILRRKGSGTCSVNRVCARGADSRESHEGLKRRHGPLTKSVVEGHLCDQSVPYSRETLFSLNG